MTDHIVVGTAGHIDHGKSTLVHALTGIDPDRLKEEKERGITIELGFAHTTIGGVTVAFVDVPGHERFVRTMLAGVGGMDAVMLVIAADESVMPQTREHFDICRLLQVRHGMVVLTKADAVDAETLELVRLEVRDLVEGSFLQEAPVLAVSARTGAGLDELRAMLQSQAAHVVRSGEKGAARLPIDRAFSMQGFGTVVTGTLLSGRLNVESELELVPGGELVRVRGLQVHGRRRDEAVAGQRTAVNLGGIEVAQVGRGRTLAVPGSLTVTRKIDAVFQALPDARPLRHGSRVRFHHGTSEVLARVSLAGPTATEVAPGAESSVRISLERPAALVRGDRFIVRAYSPTRTIGGGEVLDPDPPGTGIRTAAALERLRELRADATRAVARMIADSEGKGVSLEALSARAGVFPGERSSTASALVTAGHARQAGDRLVAPAVIRDRSKRLLAQVAEFHKAQPLAEGLPREEARERVFARTHPAVFDLVLQDLAAAGTLIVRDRLSLPGHRLELSPEELRAREAIERAYRRAGLTPPDAAGAAAESHVAPAVAEKMTSLLLRQKALMRLDTLIFHAEALSGLKADLQALKAAAPGGRATVDVAAFKDRYGVSRKFAIPLLEWLDRERVTRRVGESRVVL
jgi:selenocysteine-specific elongation factor